MKRYILIAITLLALAAPALAEVCTTKPNAFFCFSMTDMDRMIRYLTNNDEAAAMKLLDARVCGVIEGDQKVAIEDEMKGLGIVKVRGLGTTIEVWMFQKYLSACR